MRRQLRGQVWLGLATVVLILTILVVEPGRIFSADGIQVVENIAKLRECPAPAAGASYYRVAGYYTPLDGGGGDFTWQAARLYAAADSYTISAGGSNYKVGDYLGVPLAGGDAGYAQVTSVHAGEATGLVLLYGGKLEAAPPPPPGTVLATTNQHVADPAARGLTLTASWKGDNNGGSVLLPNGQAAQTPGRFVRTGIEETPLRMNVLWFGARRVDIYRGVGKEEDSLPAIEAAIAALPSEDYLPVEAPGAGRTGHIKAGVVYFPGAPQNIGYLVGGEIFGANNLTMEGDAGGGSRIKMLPGTAPDPSQEKWVIHYLFGSRAIGNANTTFNTHILNLSVVVNTGSKSLDNPGGSGILYIGCNGGSMRDVSFAGSLRGCVVYAKGVVLSNLSTSDFVLRGPGLTVSGQEVSGDYWDIEHVNFGDAPLGVLGYKTPYAYDADGEFEPAVLITNATSVSVGTIATEGSPISVKMRSATAVTLGSVHAHPINYPAGSLIIELLGCRGCSVLGIDPEGHTPVLRDRSLGGGGDAPGWDVSYNGDEHHFGVYLQTHGTPNEDSGL